MSLLVTRLAAGHLVTVEDSGTIATSFPDFLDMLTRLGATIEVKDC